LRTTDSGPLGGNASASDNTNKGQLADKAVKAGLNHHQTDEVRVFKLAAQHPDLLTGVDPATGQPAPYGSVGVDINCAPSDSRQGPDRQPGGPGAQLAVPAPLAPAAARPGDHASPGRPQRTRSTQRR
jgi:hypothetical protein